MLVSLAMACPSCVNPGGGTDHAYQWATAAMFLLPAAAVLVAVKAASRAGLFAAR